MSCQEGSKLLLRFASRGKQYATASDSYYAGALEEEGRSRKRKRTKKSSIVQSKTKSQPKRQKRAKLLDPKDYQSQQLDVIDSDGDYQEEDIRQTHDIVETRSRRITKSETFECDYIIEQWYTDPYGRLNPDDVSPAQVRSNNLRAALHNQGFSQHRVGMIANWLMRCNGQLLPFSAAKDRSRKVRRKSRQRKPTAEITDQSRDQSEANQPYQGDRGQIKDEDQYDQSGNDSEDDEDMKEEHEAIALQKMLNAEHENIHLNTPTVSDTTSQTLRNTIELSAEDQLILKLRRNLHIFDLVYGDQLPEPTPNIAFFFPSLSSMSDQHTTSNPGIPIPILPPHSYRTQGHHKLKPVSVDIPNHDGEPVPTRVLTEDPTFGLYIPPKSQVMTPGEKSLYDEQVRRAKMRNRERLIRGGVTVENMDETFLADSSFMARDD